MGLVGGSLDSHSPGVAHDEPRVEHHRPKVAHSAPRVAHAAVGGE